MKNLKKLLVLVLCAAMVLGFMPVLGGTAPAAKAEGEGEDAPVEGLYATKVVSPVKDDGTYDITMETYVTGKVITHTISTPLDIVLVLDVSGSMDSSFSTASYTKYSNSGGYSYNTINNLRRTTLYYKDADGYYAVNARTNDNQYALVYTKSNTVYYLKGTGSTTSRSGSSDANAVQYTGDLYTSTVPTKMSALKTAVQSFIDTVYADANTNNVDHKISIVKFADSSFRNSNNKLAEGNDIGCDGNYTQVVKNLTSVKTEEGAENTALTNAVSNLKADGPTAADYGMQLAQLELEKNGRADAQKVIIMFTDGEPNHGSGFDSDVANDTVSAANTMKNPNGIDATIYTVGVFGNLGNNKNNVYHYMDAVSSNIAYKANGASYTASTATRPNGKFMTATSQEELTEIFGNIATEVTGSATCNLTSTSSILDGITNYFELPTGFNINDTNDIEVKYAEQTDTTPNFDSEKSFAPSEIPSIVYNAENKTIRVTNFDYSKYFVADILDENGNNTNNVKGRKLIIKIKGITPTADAFAAALADEADPTSLPTNTTGQDGVVSGVYQDEELQQKLEGFASPTAKIKKESEKVYVIDYAAEVDVTPVDLMGVGETGNAIDVKAANDSIEGTNGNFTYTNNNGERKLTYTPKTTVWDDENEDSVYAAVLVDYTDPTTSVTTKVYGVQKLTVKPANNVYYEDDFVVGEDGVAVGIEYTGTWSADGTAVGNSYKAADDAQGWVESLADDTAYSAGSAHTTGEKGASAAISFKGTGIDVYTRTTSKTGVVFAALQKKNGVLVKAFWMDNKALSNGEGGYYQVPTLSLNGLEYGEYTLKISVTTLGNSDGDRMTYYIDGFRVYNPANNGAIFNTITDINGIEGSVFVDELVPESEGNSEVGKSFSVAEAGKYMAENEIYLAPHGSITFAVSGGTKYYVGMKSLTGEAVVAQYYKGDNSVGGTTITHTTDMYYEVIPNNGHVTISNSNTGNSGILALTKIQIIPEGNSVVSVAAVNGEEGLKAAKKFAVLCAMTEPDEADEPVELIEEIVETEPEVIVEQPAVEEADEAQQVIKLVKSIISSFRKLLKH